MKNNFIIFFFSITLTFWFSCCKDNNPISEIPEYDQTFRDADTISIINHSGEIVAQLMWSDTSMNYPITKGIKIIASIYPKTLIPFSTNGTNYKLSDPIQIKLVNIDSLKFNHSKVKLRFYLDTSLFNPERIKNNIAVQKVVNDSIFFPILVNNSIITIKDNYLEFYLNDLSQDNIFTLSALNILIGTYNKGNSPITMDRNLLVPYGHTLILNEGTKFISNDIQTITVEGHLECNGTEINPVQLTNIQIRLNGNNDNDILNNENLAKCNWLTVKGVEIKSAYAIFNNSNIYGIYADNYSTLDLNYSRINFVKTTYSKINIKYSTFDSSGYFYSANAVVDIENSKFKYYDYGSAQQSSILILKKNIVYAMNSFINPQNCFMLLEGNRIYYVGDPLYNHHAGINVIQNNYAIIKNNIVDGFRGGVEIGYDNKAVVYNNTFIGDIIYVHGTPNKISLYNNIFHNVETPISLTPSTYRVGDTIIAYIDCNLWEGQSYIANSYANCIVYNNTSSVHADPVFVNLVDYSLSSNSPAIDKGSSRIPSFTYSFQMLGEIISIGQEIIISNYNGLSPDLGAIEYGSYSPLFKSY